MRVVYFGSGEFAVPCLRWLLNSPHELLAVVTPPDRPAGRGKHLHPCPVAERALAEGLTPIFAADVNGPELRDQLAALRPELGIAIDFGQKLKEPLRSIFPAGCINAHGSLLPRYRGAAPVAHAILAGEAVTGVSVFRLVDRMDAGPVLVRRQTAIGPFETAEELECRLAGVSCDALGAALTLLSADPATSGEPQDEALATLAPKLSKADGRLRFDEPADRIARRCRAMWPWPGGRCRFVGRHGPPVDVTLTAATAAPADESSSNQLLPGSITEVLTVATAAGVLEIHSLIPAGKRQMSWQDFVNGRHVQPGDRLESLGD